MSYWSWLWPWVHVGFGWWDKVIDGQRFGEGGLTMETLRSLLDDDATDADVIDAALDLYASVVFNVANDREMVLRRDRYISYFPGEEPA